MRILDAEYGCCDVRAVLALRDRACSNRYTDLDTEHLAG
jgi:hypothetical protein